MRTEDGYIIHRCLNGDSNAFGFLVDKYKAGVYAFAYERLHNFHDAEDISQEVFLKAYKSLRTLKRWDSFASWLYRITLNLCRNWVRAQSSRPDHEFMEDQDPEVLEAHSRNTYRQELAYESVGEALDSLPEMYSQALTLHYFGGMTSMEIARFTGVSPSAIRMRLRRARSLLKEEILTMMSTKYEQQRLQASFTFRILEAVKRVRIHPTPRTAGLPWGLSLATGIIVTFLTLTPQPNIISHTTTATGSPMPVETKVLKNGEIPVDVLEASEIPILASKLGDGDSAGSELPDPQTSMLSDVNSEDDISTNESASEKQVITDPETGVEYTKIGTLTGKSDVIQQASDHLWGVGISPNGRFLLQGRVVIPLDGQEPYPLMDRPGGGGTWSPDGKKVAFYSEGDIWVIPVSPETGRATGSASKLLDGDYRNRLNVRWSPDSERIVFGRRDEEVRDDIWVLSVTDGVLTQITDDPVFESWYVWSPDGKTIAYQRGDEIRVIPAEGGTYRKIVEGGNPRPLSWSPDSEWLVYYTRDGKNWLSRLTDGYKLDITPPEEVGTHFAWSPGGRNKMLFYRSSYYYKSSLKVVSTSGGPSFELGRELKLWPYDQFWSPNTRMIVTTGKSKDDDWLLWIIPLAESEPFLLELDVSVPGELIPYSLSPDCRKLLFSVKRSDDTEDLWVVPISLEDGRTAGSAVMLFGTRDGESPQVAAWSPDGKKLAVIYEGDIWIASAQGGEPVRITETPEVEILPTWSPVGEMIAYRAYYSQRDCPLMVIPASGGEPRKIFDDPKDEFAWSSDGKELTVVSGEGRILAVSIANGETRQVADLRELDVDEAYGIRWSPDGQKVAFASYNRGPGRSGPGPIFTVSTEEGKVTKLAADDPGEKYSIYWSPDGKWISYNSDGMVKTRPEGTIWEADVSELLSSQEKEQ